MKRTPYRIPLLSALLLLAAVPPPPASSASVTPTLGLRVRQEYLANVYYFDPNESDRDWIRYRTRAGARWNASEDLAFEVRFANEFRKIYEPETKIDYDEIVIDRLLGRWTSGGERPWTVTLGRQDIVWNDGFLILEGHPFDGSRTMDQTALRVERVSGGRRLDAALIANRKRDPWVVAGDEHRALSDGDERGFAARVFTDDGDQIGLVVKREKDPDHVRPVFTSYTLDLRRVVKGERIDPWLGEVALQHQITSAGPGFALAAQGAHAKALGEKTTGRVGFYYYSGGGDGMKGFRSPWGRWPKWSEMWVYSLVGEGGVAEWRNLAAPYFEVDRALHAKATLHAALHVPWAPEKNWEDRGLLAIGGVKIRFAPRVTGHLLAEWHVNGSYPPGFDEDAWFLRWQLSYDI